MSIFYLTSNHFLAGQCLGVHLHFEEKIISQEGCLKACQDVSECEWFTFFKDQSICELLADCQAVDGSCPTCVSGQTSCEMKPKGKNVTLIFEAVC